MTAVEMKETNGGNIGYLNFVWSGTDNEIVYAFEAAINGGILLANGGIAIANGATWLWNQIF